MNLDPLYLLCVLGVGSAVLIALAWWLDRPHRLVGSGEPSKRIVLPAPPDNCTYLDQDTGQLWEWDPENRLWMKAGAEGQSSRRRPQTDTDPR